MTQDLNGTRKLNLVRSLALGVTVAGALGSLALTLQAGGQSGSVILILLFSIWVLSPFIVLLNACVHSLRWPSRTRIFLYILMLSVSFISLLFYGGLLSFSGAKPAFVFLVIPLLSWVIIFSMYAFLKR